MSYLLFTPVITLNLSSSIASADNKIKMVSALFESYVTVQGRAVVLFNIFGQNLVQEMNQNLIMPK